MSVCLLSRKDFLSAIVRLSLNGLLPSSVVKRAVNQQIPSYAKSKAKSLEPITATATKVIDGAPQKETTTANNRDKK